METLPLSPCSSAPHQTAAPPDLYAAPWSPLWMWSESEMAMGGLQCHNPHDSSDASAFSAAMDELELGLLRSAESSPSPAQSNETKEEGVCLPTTDEPPGTKRKRKLKQEKGNDGDGFGGEAEKCSPRTKQQRERGPKLAIKTKSPTNVIEDGYRWRKYGEKTMKNSPYPRSYYKCTNRQCHVKKQVERCAWDPDFVITTYEGVHNHAGPTILQVPHLPLILSKDSSPLAYINYLHNTLPLNFHGNPCDQTPAPHSLQQNMYSNEAQGRQQNAYW